MDDELAESFCAGNKERTGKDNIIAGISSRPPTLTKKNMWIRSSTDR